MVRKGFIYKKDCNEYELDIFYMILYVFCVYRMEGDCGEIPPTGSPDHRRRFESHPVNESEDLWQSPGQNGLRCQYFCVTCHATKKDWNTWSTHNHHETWRFADDQQLNFSSRPLIFYLIATMDFERMKIAMDFFLVFDFYIQTFLVCLYFWKKCTDIVDCSLTSVKK